MKIQALGCGCKRSTANYEASRQSGQGIRHHRRSRVLQGFRWHHGDGHHVDPGFVIDNKIYAMGRVLTVEQAKELLKQAQSGCGWGCGK
jgi:hypothetical protein